MKVVGARVVSVQRARAARPVTVKFPGAAHVVVRVHEDVTLRRKETLKISREREEVPAGTARAGGSREDGTIKGNQRGRRHWRAFRVQVYCQVLILHFEPCLDAFRTRSDVIISMKNLYNYLFNEESHNFNQ